MASDIKVKFDLETSGVHQKLQEIGGRIKNFSEKAVTALNKVVKAAGAALVASFTVAAKSALEYAKEMTNLSQVANTNFEDFQKLAAAAKTVGIENDKLADIYKDMTDRVGDYLATGGGPMADWFENIAPLIGATKEEFIGLSGPEALQKYYDGLVQANATQEEMTFYLEAIASDATALIPLLANGGAKFNQLGLDAINGGRVMSQATADNLKKAQDAIDAFKVKAIIKVGEIIGDGGGGLKKLGAGFMLLMANVGDWLINSFTAAAKLLVVLMVAGVATVGQKLMQAFEKAALHLQVLLAPVVNMLAGAFNIDVNIDVEAIKEKIQALDYETKTFAQNFTDINDSLGDWNVNLTDSIQHWRDIYKTTGDEKTQIDEINKLKKGGLKTDQDAKDLADKKTQLAKLELEMEKQKHAPMSRSKEILIEQYDELKRIVALMTDHGVGLNEAEQIIEDQNQDLRDQKALIDAIMAAQAAGNNGLVIQLTIIEGIRKRALELQEKTNMTYSEALQYAEDEYKLKEGDFDLSGNITKEEQKQLENYQKMVKKANEKFEANQKTDSILKRSLLPSWEKNRQIHDQILRGLRTKNDVLEQMKAKAKKYELAQKDVTAAVDDTVYKLEKASNEQSNVKTETENVEGAEAKVAAAIEKSNVKRREAVNLTAALQNQADQNVNIQVTHSIVSDLNSTLVPHLKTTNTLLTQINSKLDC